MTLTYIQVTSLASDGSDAASNGTVTFTASQTVYASGIPQVFPDTPVEAQFTNGQLRTASGGTVQLLAQGNSGLTLESATGFWWWTVSITYNGPAQVTDGWSFQLGTSPASIDLYSTRNSPVNGALTNPMTTPGDMIDGGVSGAPQRLPGPTASGTWILTDSPSAGTASPPAWSQSVQFAGFAAVNVATLPFGTAITPNCGTANTFNLTLTGAGGSIVTPLGPHDGQVMKLRIYQGGTAGNTVGWGTAYDFGSAGSPTLSGTAKLDIIGFEYDAALGAWCCLGSGLGF